MIKRGVLLLALLLSPMALASQDCSAPFASPSLSAEDPIYILIEKLFLGGYLPHTILHQNNLNEREALRLLSHALPRLEEDSSLRPWTATEYERIRARVCTQSPVSIHAPEKLSVLFDSSNSARDYRMNGLGHVKGSYAPLHRNEFGGRFFNGEQLAFQSSAQWKISRYSAGQWEPRFEMEWPDGAKAFQGEVFLRRANVTLAWRNFEILIGRDDWHWGPTHTGGLASSLNPRPIDQVRVSSSRPWRLPGFFKHIGPVKVSALLANLGPHRHNDYSWAFGWKASFSPSRFFEFGIGRSMIFGGKNAPDMSVGRFLREVFYHPLNFSPGGGGSNISDQKSYIDFHLRAFEPFPFALYSELVVEDNRKNILKSFSNFLDSIEDVVGVKAGLFLPDFFDPRLSMRLEYVKIPAVFYSHSVWRDGYNLSGGSLGDAWGRDSRSVGLKAEWAQDRHQQLSMNVSYVLRTGDRYKQIFHKPDGIRRVTVTENKPNEHSIVLDLAGRWALGNQWIARGNLGLEHAESFEFSNDRQRWLYRVGSGFEFLF